MARQAAKAIAFSFVYSDPRVLRPYIPNVWWNMEVLRKKKLPVRTLMVVDLLWHLELPWWQDRGEVFRITPRQVLDDQIRYQQAF